MEFPVDMLGSVRHEEEEQAAEGYMTQLRYVSPDKAESFTLPSHRMICISLCNVGFVPIYGGDLKHKILALFAPEDQLTAVALFLAGQWWSVEDILRTSDSSRTGLLKVRSLGERIVLYILNRIVYRVGEMDKPEVPFLCHGQNHFAKLLWKDGHAVGFYSVKPKDSLCNGFVTQRYQLPVMDSIFVRKCHRGNSHGLQMLEDFVDSFKDDQLGLKYPLSLTMYKVCGQYLCRYPADQDLLWVVEGVGGPYQRERVANKIKALKVVLPVVTANGDHQAASLDSTDVNMEEGSDNCLDISEDVLVLDKPLKLIEALEGTPVSTHTWSSGHKKRGREEMEDSEEESQPLKMNRLEEAEPTTTAVEGGEEEKEGSGGDETASGEAEAALAPIEEAKAQEAEVKGELTDDQGEEEEEVATQEPDAVLEHRTTEEDVEMEEEEEEEDETKEEDSIEAKATIDAAPVASEELAETEAVVEEEVEKEAPLLLVEEPASATEKATLPAEPSPAEHSLSGEVIEEAGGEPPEEAAATPMEGKEVEGEKEGVKKAVKEEEKSMEVAITVDSSSQETVVQVGVADLSYQPPEEGENQPLAEEEGEVEAREEVKEDKKKEVEEMENVSTTEDEKEEGESESSDEGGDGKVLWRRGSGRAATPKRKSKRLSRVVMEPEEQDTEQPEVTEEEQEKAITTEEEDGAVEKSLAEEEVEKEDEEEEHPPVIDQRALRRKSRQVQAPKKAKGKRRSKI